MDRYLVLGIVVVDGTAPLRVTHNTTTIVVITLVVMICDFKLGTQHTTWTTAPTDATNRKQISRLACGKRVNTTGGEHKRRRRRRHYFRNDRYFDAVRARARAYEKENTDVCTNVSFGLAARENNKSMDSRVELIPREQRQQQQQQQRQYWLQYIVTIFALSNR